MDILEVKEIFAKSLFSTIGITKVHPLTFDENFTTDEAIALDDEKLLDYIYVDKTDLGWNFQIGLSILDGIQTKFIATQLNQNVTNALKRKKQKLDKLTIIFRGVINE
ncbi:hypothetical protein [Mycoplasma hafezii]|uniref:hypothetical protein n=1 Tax=Mycoplasma hafezii TaxID=525886 RepID=UPI003CF27A0C